MALKRYNGTAWVVTTAADIGAEPAFSKNTAFNRNFGNIVNTVCEGNDPRLSVYNLGTFVSENALIQYILTNQLSSGLYKIGVGAADGMLSLSDQETYYYASVFTPQGRVLSTRITKEGEVDYYVKTDLKALAEVEYVDTAIGNAVYNLVDTNDSRLSNARTPTALVLNGAIGGHIERTNTTGLTLANAPYTILTVSQSVYDGIAANIKAVLLRAYITE